MGLSPRGRGNPQAIGITAVLIESIPAWAGKPVADRLAGGPPWVYPRVGGETRVVASVECSGSGLSPRGRGNRVRGVAPTTREGSIPAWAGKPRPAWPTWHPRTVYPRVGGETDWWFKQEYLCQGLSPRGRGNREEGRVGGLCDGSIPAWAGKPLRSYLSRGWLPVYPRVGGETCSSRSA